MPVSSGSGERQTGLKDKPIIPSPSTTQMKGVLMMNFGKKMAVGVASAALVASLAGVPAAVAV
ncbi:hypothetical protein, partial [Mobiluncus mulieris]|uniref:hypothetical protein n=1 Tax=Mobiluncus mulieris TaxID=2052 RepID=UPI0014704CF2